ncbi:hypothetical protein SAMN05216338_107627 [Bradyrhizobium sp. Rc2d]|nr:hypothetical protein SAMN05216338_107627 [Bradyrhizobium sp. Rc2d]
MDLTACSRAPGSQVLPSPCGSLPAWSPPSPGPHPTDRSPARLPCLDDRRNHCHIRTTTGPDRDRSRRSRHRNGEPGNPLWPCSALLALPAKSGRRHHGIHYRRHKLYFFRFRMIARCFSQLTSPAKQLLRRQSVRSGYRTDRVAARHDLRNDPRLVLVAPLPSTAGCGEDLKPPHRLRDSSMHCVF